MPEDWLQKYYDLWKSQERAEDRIRLYEDFQHFISENPGLRQDDAARLFLASRAGTQ